MDEVTDSTLELDSCRWPASAALWTLGLLPATVCRRTQHVPLKNAFGVHFISLVLCLLAIVTLVAWSDADAQFGVFGIAAGVADTLDSFVQEFSANPGRAMVTVVGITAAIEIDFVILAFVLIAWGARDEPVRSSFTHTLRQCWLRTPHIALAILLVGAVMVPLRNAEHDWFQDYGNSVPPTRPSAPLGAPSDSPLWKAYDKAMEKHQVQQEKYRASLERAKPWHVRFTPPLIMNSVVMGAIWILWGFLRSIGGPREVIPIARAPMCDRCGYNLTTMPEESRCPECGMPIVESLGTEARSGTAWQHRASVGRVAGFMRSSADAIFRPRVLGRQFQVLSAATDHRRVVAIAAPAVFLIATCGVFLLFAISEGLDFFWHEPEVLLIGPFLGILTLGAVTLFSTLSACLVGLFHGRRTKRNMLGAAMQASSYLYGFMAIWVAYALSAIVVVTWASRYGLFAIIEGRSNLRPGMLPVWTWVLLNVPWLIWYFRSLSHATSAARFSNR